MTSVTSPIETANRRRRAGRGRRLLRTVAPALITGIIVLVALELFSRSGIVPSILFPGPLDIFSAMATQATTSFLWSNLGITFVEGLAGFVIASVIGLTFGIGIALSDLIARAVYPYVILFQAMPRVALAPVIIAFFGFGIESKIVIATAIAFFPVLINTIIGLREVDQSALLLMRSLHATRRQIFTKLLLPSALPSIFGGLKAAMTFAFVGAIVGELEAANMGIGQLVQSAAFQLRIDAMFGYILWLALLSLLIFGAMEWIDRKVVFWTEDIRVDT